MTEGIYSMTSSPDGALFIIAFSGGGPIYRSRPGHDTEWSKVIATEPGQPLFRTIYAPTATTVLGSDYSHLMRWDEGNGIIDFGAAGPGKWCGDFATGVGVTAIWGRSDHDAFAVGSPGVIFHYDGSRWTSMRNPIGDEQIDPCTAPSWASLSSVGGDEHDVFADGERLLHLTTGGQWTELQRPKGIGPHVSTFGIAAQSGSIFFGGGEFIRTNTDPPQFYSPLRLYSFSSRGLQTIGGFENVLWMNGGGSQPGSAAVFWSFDKDLVIIDGTTIRPVRMKGLRSVRGAVAIGHTVYVAGLAPDGDDDIVVRLR